MKVHLRSYRWLAVVAGIAALVCVAPVAADVPDLTEAQTHALELAAARGDLAAAENLYWQGGPEPEARRIYWLLFAAQREDCSAIEMAVEHFETTKEWRPAEQWTQNYAEKRCERVGLIRQGLWFSEHDSIVRAAESGDCKSVETVRHAIQDVGDPRSPWLRRRPDRHGC